MSASDDTEREPEGDDIVAAEYVLGVQSAQDRQATARRIDTDRTFAGLVERWEENFSPLSQAYAETTPPERVKAAIDRVIYASGQPSEAKSGFWQSLALWRGLALASVAALALVVALPMLNPPAPVERQQLVASLAEAEGSGVQYLAVYDPALSRVGLSHVSGELANGRAMELWMIVGDAAPVSLGLVPAGSTAAVTLDQAKASALADGAVLAISDEPAGGSPTGAPTGPVVAAGDLRNI